MDIIHALNVKTYGYMLNHVDKLARDLYSGSSTRDQFVDSMADLIEQQLRRAWNEGMRNNELDPQTDMTDEWEEIFQELVTDQFNYIEGYADAIVQGANNDYFPEADDHCALVETESFSPTLANRTQGTSCAFIPDYSFWAARLRTWGLRKRKADVRDHYRV